MHVLADRERSQPIVVAVDQQRRDGDVLRPELAAGADRRALRNPGQPCIRRRKRS